MSKPPSAEPRDEQPSEEYSRFERLTRALFQVDKRDVPKHVPVKRQPKGR
jgi:hypothetical protein